MRIALKVAIIETGRSQRDIAAEVHIPESRLSTLVRGWADPTNVERINLEKLLGNDIFGDDRVLEQRSARR